MTQRTRVIVKKGKTQQVEKYRYMDSMLMTDLKSSMSGVFCCTDVDFEKERGNNKILIYAYEEK